MEDNIKGKEEKEENGTKARIVEFAPEVQLKEDPEVLANIDKNLKEFEELTVENEKQTKNMMAFNLLSNLFSSSSGSSIATAKILDKKDLVDSIVEYVDIFVERTNFKL